MRTIFLRRFSAVGCIPVTPVPKKRMLKSTEDGGGCNLTAFGMCAHNGRNRHKKNADFFYGYP